MKIAAMIDTMEQFAPRSLAMDWDNVGLLAGDPDASLTGVVVCLDITERVYALCLETRANLCISHHPFLFEPIRRLDQHDPHMRILTKMLQSGIAIYAAHTNLDVCEGGVSDCLAMTVGLHRSDPAEVLMPEGAGMLPDDPTTGSWRICRPAEPMRLFAFYRIITERLGIPGCFQNFDTDRPVGKVLVLGGSYSTEWNHLAYVSGVDTILCGEMRYHDMLEFAHRGIAVIAAGHDASERVVLPKLAEHLRRMHPQISIAVWMGFDYNGIVF
jgi:GTP cyclohydrolase I